MERLLLLRLDCQGVCAEASLNGLPLLRCTGAQDSRVLAVHEFTLAGANEIELCIEPEARPPDSPRLAAQAQVAVLRLLLPRVGQLASPEHARQLAELSWSQAADTPYRVPLRLRESVEIPVKFPRWRWLDAPPQAEIDAGAIARFLQEQALALAAGDPEPFIQATRLRFEELALAYQRPLADELARWRARVQLLAAQKALRPPLPEPDSLKLRAVAGGRLVECLGVDGLPALRCARPDGSELYWPLRLACVDGRYYGLR